MSRAISPKLSIGSILNEAPPAPDALPPIKTLPASVAPAPPASIVPLHQSPIQASGRPDVPREHRSERDHYSQYKTYFTKDSYTPYGRPGAPVNAVYGPCQELGDVRAPMPIINGMVASSYEPQAVYGYFPNQESCYASNVYFNYTQRPELGMQYGQKSRRFRRRYYQIHRKYKCSYEGCTKSYGSLNHLNTHIVTKQHGSRKCKSDFRASEEEAERNSTDQSSPRSEDEKKEVEEEGSSPNEYPEPEQAHSSRFTVPSVNQTPKHYSLPLPPLYKSDSCSMRLPSLPSIISQCSSS